jgi:NTP pyrophosphatase (non-canonical NTP hydrolase)
MDVRILEFALEILRKGEVEELYELMNEMRKG